MNEFDIKAKTWDMNAMHLDRSRAVAAEMGKMIPLRNDMKVLEYGAGTGLLSFQLKDSFASVTLLDSSEKMVEICREKIAVSGDPHMKTLLMDLQHQDLHEQFDLIYSQMVFHHVVDIEGMIGKFHTLLSTGGYVAIADLYSEDGSFHGMDVTDVHRGFDIEKLARQMEMKGFRNVQHKKVYVMKRSSEQGSVKEFPTFLLVGQK